MDDQHTRYAVLRAGRTWDGVTDSHLQAMPDGVLTLARVPGPVDGQAIAVPGPYDVAPSGLAVGDCNDLYIADTAGNRLVWIDGLCGARMVLPGHDGAGAAPGQFNAPRGLLIGPPGGLYVADSGNGRLQRFRLPTLEVHAIWEGTFDTPTGLAADSQDRVYVLDRGLGRVLRFSAWGAPDEVYNAALAATPDLASPAFLVVAGDTLYVSDEASNAVLRFDPDGHLLGALPPAGADPFHPRALVAHDERLFVADAAGGSIWVFDRLAGHYLGAVSGYRGPVSALAVNEAGALFVKPGLDETFHMLEADAAYVETGELTSGPLDAGERSDWMRVAATADVPSGAAVKLHVFVAGDATAAPGADDWFEAQALDTWLPPPLANGNGQPGHHRYLWLRLFLASDRPDVTPLLRQVQAETAGEEYMNYLPAIYRRDHDEHSFLRHWLTLFRSQLGDLEWTLEAMARRFDPATTPEDHLEWLASWLAFDPPPGWATDDLRALLPRLFQLYRRRGTPFGVAEFVQLYTGVRPVVIEAFPERRFWMLDHTSSLGFDTGLAPLGADGIVVPELTAAGCQVAPAETVGDGVWTEPAGLVVGEVVVGQSGPLAAAEFGEPLFSETAHRFTVLAPAALAPQPAQRQAIREIIEMEKPAHTDFYLCFLDARLRVGLQACIGIDSIIAGPPEPMSLDETTLGVDSTLGEKDGEEGLSRLGQSAYLGFDMFVK